MGSNQKPSLPNPAHILVGQGQTTVQLSMVCFICADVWLQVDGWMDGHAIQIRFPQDSLGEAQEMERERCLEAYIMDSLVSHGYQKGIINVNDLSI